MVSAMDGRVVFIGDKVVADEFDATVRLWGGALDFDQGIHDGGDIGADIGAIGP